jgi:hypothetical protein
MEWAVRFANRDIQQKQNVLSNQKIIKKVFYKLLFI